MTFDPKRIGNGVRTLRQSAGLTQAELAERAGLAFETVSRVESGREPPSLRTAIQLADALGSSLDAITSRTKPEKPKESLSAVQRRAVRAISRIEPKLLSHIVVLLDSLRPRGSKGRS